MWVIKSRLKNNHFLYDVGYFYIDIIRTEICLAHVEAILKLDFTQETKAKMICDLAKEYYNET